MRHVWVAVLVSCIRSRALLMRLVVLAALIPETTLAISWVLLTTLELVLHGERREELSDLVIELITSSNVVPLRCAVVDLLEALEAKLILGLFVDDIAVFLQLVVAYLELPVVDGPVVELLECLLSLIGRLKAHKGVGLILLVNGEELDTLNLTEVTEHGPDCFLGGLGVEVLDVQIAALLGVLVLDGLAEFLLLALEAAECGLHVELLAITHVLSVQLAHGVVSVLGAILMVILVLAHEADEGELTVLMRHLDEGLNTTKGREEFGKLLVTHVLGVVLHVEVVGVAAHIIAVFWLVRDRNAILVGLRLLQHLNGNLGVIGVLIGDKTIAAGSMVFVHGDFQGLNWACLALIKVGELRVKISCLHVLGDLAHENAALLVGLGEVGTEERVVEGQATALLTLDLEVAKYFGGLLKLVIILDAANARIEGLGRVSAHLWLQLQLDACLFQDLGESGRGELCFGQIVEVDEVSFLWGSVSLHGSVDF